MRVSIVAQEADEWSARQLQLFTAQGNTCQLYLQEQISERDLEGKTISPAAFLKEEHVRGTEFFLFHFADEVYPLLETIKQLQHGLVAIDLRDAIAYERALVHYADLCIVANAEDKRVLQERTGCAPERICVLPDRQDCEEAWEMTIDQAMQGRPPQTAEMEIDSNMTAPTIDDLESVLLIRDVELDRSAILNRVRQAIRRRQAVGGYGPSVASLGPEALRRTPLGGDAKDQAYASLLRFQSILDDLASQSHLQEPDFHSSVPLVGSLIVAVRRFWNWMSAKWYVRGWMTQQAAFNTRAVDAVEELLRIQESNEQRIHKLERQVERLRMDRGEAA